jgi:cysteinyl-tRNA synthetase
MSKSFGNYFLPKEIVEGTSTLFTKAYPAAVVRFFMLQAHYRSTLDITEEALNASEKGFERLMEGLSLLEKLSPSSASSFEVAKVLSAAEAAICDDFNAPILIASLFDAVKYIHAINEGKEHLTQEDLLWFTQAMTTFVQDVLGIEPSKREENQRLSGVMDMVITLRQQAREQKDWTTSDMIRDGLAKAGIQIKDSKEGTSWS